MISRLFEGLFGLSPNLFFKGSLVFTSSLPGELRLILFIGGAALVAFLYRHAGGSLPKKTRYVLLGIRLTLLLLLAFLLGAPVLRVRRGERVGGDTAVRSVRLSRPVCAYDPLADKRAIGEVNDGLNRFLNSPEGVAAAAISLKQILSAHDAFLNGRLVTVSAVIDNDAAGLPPRQVTVDLSRIGLSCRTPLAPAGNGVYEATFAVDPANIRQIEKDWRQIQPIGLTVTAVSEAGGLSSGIGALAVANTATRAQYHNGDSPRKVESGNVKFIGNESKVYRTGRKIMGTQVVEPGPWQVSYQSGWGRQTMDISSFQVVALWIRASRESTEDIVLELQDDPTFGTPSTTPGLPLIAGGFVPGGKFTEEFKQIVIPVSKLIGGSETFHPSILRCLLISGKAGAPIDYYIDKIVLYDSAEAAVSDVEGQ